MPLWVMAKLNAATLLSTKGGPLSHMQQSDDSLTTVWDSIPHRLEVLLKSYLCGALKVLVDMAAEYMGFTLTLTNTQTNYADLSMCMSTCVNVNVNNMNTHPYGQFVGSKVFELLPS